MLEHGYSARVSYCRSKLANILFTKELARRLTDRGARNVSVNCLHPGFVASGFGHNNSRLVSTIMSVAGLFALSPEDGAKTSIYLATAPRSRARPASTSTSADRRAQPRVDGCRGCPPAVGDLERLLAKASAGDRGLVPRGAIRYRNCTRKPWDG